MINWRNGSWPSLIVALLVLAAVVGIVAVAGCAPMRPCLTNEDAPSFCGKWTYD